MLTALSWFLFGMLVWCCCIVMQAFERRWAPSGASENHRRRNRGWEPRDHHANRDATPSDTERELKALRERIATLEAIITDRKYQWEQEFKAADRR